MLVVILLALGLTVAGLCALSLLAREPRPPVG
jgi:hypothetical protein